MAAGVPRTPRLTRLRLVAGLALASVMLCASAASAYSVRYSGVVGPLDSAVVDIVLLGSQGEPIFATNETTAQRLYAESGEESLLATYRPTHQSVVMLPRSSGRSLDLTSPFAMELLGRNTGTFVTALYEAPFGGWEERTEFDRTIGPFPRTHRVDVETFASAFPNASVGDRIALDAFVSGNATLVSLSPESAEYHVELAEGETMPVLNLGFTARAVNVTPDAFMLQYTAEVGHVFVVRGTCGAPFYELQTGSYRVEAIDDERIVLLRSDAPYPELVARDVRAEVTVHLIQKFAALKRDN